MKAALYQARVDSVDENLRRLDFGRHFTCPEDIQQLRDVVAVRVAKAALLVESLDDIWGCTLFEWSPHVNL